MKQIQVNYQNFYIDIALTSRNIKAAEIKKLRRSVQALACQLHKFSYAKNGLALKKKEVKSFELSLLICGDSKMKSLNSQFRGKNKTTDVLSFPQFENLRSLSNVGALFDGQLSFGDIIISKDVALKQAKSFSIKYEQELLHLAIHGFLHLCGWDHEISEHEEKVMTELEQNLVSKVYKILY